MTTNAYAQTNTDRLMEVVDNTRSANTMLASIQELLTSLVSDVMEAIAALAGNVEAVSETMSEEFDAVGNAISHVDEEVAALDSKVMMLDSTLMDIRTQVSSLGDQITTLDQRTQQIDTNYQASVDNFAVILPAIKETVDALAASQSDASLESISEGVSANAARINEITTSLETISTQLGTIQDELDIVVNTTATTATAQERAPLTGPSEGDLNLKISPYDIAKNVKDKKATVMYSFMCEEDIFIKSVDRANRPATLVDTAEDLGGLDDDDDDATTRDDKVTISVSGPVSGMLYDSKFVGAGAAQRLDTAIAGMNAPLLANNTLTITLTANEDALNNEISFQHNQDDDNTDDEIYVKAATATTAQTAGTDDIDNITELATNLKKDLHIIGETGTAPAVQVANTKISPQILGPTIYELKVSWISDAKDAKCEFMRTGATADTSIATMALSPTDTRNVLNKATKTLDCNGVDTTIVGINPIMSGALREATTLKFTIAGDDAASAVFGFDVNGTHTLKDGYEDALPLELGSKDLEIEAELSTVTTLLLQVEYQSADGNKCTSR